MQLNSDPRGFVYVFVAAILLLAAGAHWSLSAATIRMTSLLRDARTRLQPPALMTGLRVPFDIAWGRQRLTVPFEGRQLMIVSSDSCGACIRFTPSWVGLIHTLPFRKGDGIIVASLGGQIPKRLLAAAEERRIPAQFVQVQRPYLLTQAVGVLSTPTTFAISEDGRIGVVVTPEVLSKHAQILTAYFEREF